MGNNKKTKEKIVILIGTFNLLISLLFVKDNFEIFLLFFIIFSICFIYNRKIILTILGRPIIKELCKMYNIKSKLKEDIRKLELKHEEILDNILNNKEDIDAINKYRESLNKLILREKQLKIDIIKLEDKKQTINQMIKQDEIINKAIEREEKTFNILLQENNKLEDKKQELLKEINILKKKINPIKEKIEFINKCNLNYVDNLNGFEFEKFCTKLLEVNGYENVQNTQESVDYGIDIIAEKDNIKYAIQCKRYENKVGNDAIQEAMTGKDYYGCNIAIVLTNSTFTHNAQRLSKSAGVILWDRTILNNMIERKRENILQ